MVDAHVKCLIVVTEDVRRGRGARGIEKGVNVERDATGHAADHGQPRDIKHAIRTVDHVLIPEEGAMAEVIAPIHAAPCRHVVDM